MLEKLLQNRHSVRHYEQGALELESVVKILWAGVGRNKFKRTIPSAGACYPLEAYLVVGEVNDLEVGVYHYNITIGTLEKTKDGDLRQELFDAALSQKAVANGKALIIIVADHPRILGRYHRRGYRYACMEAGHAGQNITLQAMSLGIGTVMIGAFRDSVVKDVLGINEDPLYIIPLGLVKESFV
jgi:SagB-type dehydrogenase family enzyme